MSEVGAWPECSRSRLRRGNRLNENSVCQLFADAKACIADLANKSRFASHYFDSLVFAEAKFAEAVPEFRRGREVFDADRCPCLHTTQRTNLGPGTLAFQDV